MDMGTVLAALDESTVGVFAYVMRSGRTLPDARPWLSI